MEVEGELRAGSADGRAVQLLLGAMEGNEVLVSLLEGGEPLGGDAPAESQAPDAEAVFLLGISAEGFRGIGPSSTIEFDPGPGLTVVVGRNGSGKSSFSDALEVALTGDSYRWKDKVAEWKKGWRNLHQHETARVSATFTTDGHRGTTVVQRSWDGAISDVDDGSAWAQHHGEPRTDLAGLGWVEPIELYRPLLSYSELGVILASPSGLFDTLSAVLGLDQLTDATERLRQARLAAERIDKEAKKRLKVEILPLLEASNDPRAARCAEALSGHTWDLDTVGTVVSIESDAATGVGVLARLDVPPLDAASPVIGDLKSAISSLEALRGTDTARARRIIDLLTKATEHHHQVGDTECPVCGVGSLDDTWREAAASQIVDLKNAAVRYDKAVAERDAAMRRARSLTNPVSLPDQVPGIDLGRLEESATALADMPHQPEETIEHLRNRYPDYVAQLDAVVTQARQLHSETEERWRPIALTVAGWLEDAQEALASRPLVSDLKAAEGSAKDVTDTLRTRRFEPIADQALDLWRRLRLQSNVELTSVELSGSGPRRRVDLSVNVDGTEGAALGVVSQGEINCLALSLFFPRATLPESPFRFIVIDDPVQAMDPARVDGLARVFADLAVERQLIVFTHDDRLPESLRRLALPHSVIEVTRRPGSIVETKKIVDPMYQYFQDAWATAKDEALPDGVASRVVPGMCRMGVEAACHVRIRRDLLGQGVAHADVERRISEAHTLHQIVALALFGEIGETGKVLGHLNGWGRQFGDVFQACNKGSHGPYVGSLENLTNDARSLSQRIVHG